MVTWNGCSFDLPFLAIRAAVCDTPLGLELWCRTGADAGASLPDVCWPPPPQGFGGRWAPHAHLDGYLTYRADVRRSLGLSCGLKAMSRLVGLQPVEVDYDQLHTLSDHDLAAYAASDARLACRLVQRRRLQQRTGISGESAAVQEVLVKIEQMAPGSSTVLPAGSGCSAPNAVSTSVDSTTMSSAATRRWPRSSTSR